MNFLDILKPFIWPLETRVKPIIPLLLAGLAGAGIGAATAGGNKPQEIKKVDPFQATNVFGSPIGLEALQGQRAANLGAQQALGQGQTALGQQQALVEALQAQGGLGKQTDVFSQQQALANQLGLMAAGQGPSVAQAQLAQATGQNIANQAALMAGQRGASQNPALLARMAAQQGGALQQQAVGQGAALRAQEQLAAIQALQGQQGMQAGLASQLAGQQIGGTQALTGATQQQVQLAQAQQQAMAQQQQALAQQQLAVGQEKLGARGQDVTQRGQDIGLQSAREEAGAKKDAAIIGGIGSLISGGISAAAGKMAHGGEVADSSNQTAILKENTNPYKSKVLTHLMNVGGTVPGKAKVSGDSHTNDTVHALLSPGEIVIPRTIAQSKNAPEAAAKFVAALKSKKGRK